MDWKKFAYTSSQGVPNGGGKKQPYKKDELYKINISKCGYLNAKFNDSNIDSKVRTYIYLFILQTRK